jgi:hypothetical protein
MCEFCRHFIYARDTFCVALDHQESGRPSQAEALRVIKRGERTDRRGKKEEDVTMVFWLL